MITFKHIDDLFHRDPWATQARRLLPPGRAPARRLLPPGQAARRSNH